MPTTDKRVDAYIANAPDYAKPILTRVREIVHEACPDCEETLKWSRPTFVYEGIMCGMAAFKEYVTVNFWKQALIPGTTSASWERLNAVRSVKDLPSKKELASYVKAAMALNASGAKTPKRAAKPKPKIATPDYFLAALAKNKKALAAFEAFSPSHKREYLEWITGAKGEDTRARRVAQAVEWMAEGKPRNWKYM